MSKQTGMIRYYLKVDERLVVSFDLDHVEYTPDKFRDIPRKYVRQHQATATAELLKRLDAMKEAIQKLADGGEWNDAETYPQWADYHEPSSTGMEYYNNPSADE